MKKIGIYLILAAILSVVLPFVGFGIKLLTGNPVLTGIAAVVGIVLIVLDLYLGEDSMYT